MEPDSLKKQRVVRSLVSSVLCMLSFFSHCGLEPTKEVWALRSELHGGALTRESSRAETCVSLGVLAPNAAPFYICKQGGRSSHHVLHAARFELRKVPCPC